MRVLSIIDKISEWSGRICSFLVIPMIAVITCEVVLRYVFGRPSLWAFETTQFAFGAFSILGGAYALRHESHVKMDVLYSRLSPRHKRTLDLITAPLFFSFGVALLWGGARMAWESLRLWERSTSLWHPPIYPIKAAIPLGAFLILLQGAAEFIRDWIARITKENIS